MTTTPSLEQDPEFVAMTAVYHALKDLQPEARTRVLSYVVAKLKIPKLADDRAKDQEDEPRRDTVEAVTAVEDKQDDETEDLGISAVAKKWLTRNGIQASQLDQLFSIGGEEIDLISDSVPGGTKRERMRSVFLLKGVAAYLGTGAARFTHDQLKEACQHYDAWDASHFALIFENLSSEVSGNAKSGYTLTSRGLALAARMVKDMVKGQQAAD